MTWLGTFHSIGVKIRHRHQNFVGLNPTFPPFSTPTTDTPRQTGDRGPRLDENAGPRAFSGDRRQTPLEEPRPHPDKVPAGRRRWHFADGLAITVYSAYQDRLNRSTPPISAICSFTTLRLFSGILTSLRYQDQFRYMLVDEYHRTPSGAISLAAPVGAAAQNICCVGDDDQSIYGWRGAEVENILRFEKDFPGAKVIRLESNYRSTPHILGAASGLIAANEDRLGKTLWTDQTERRRKRQRSRRLGRRRRSAPHWRGHRGQIKRAGTSLAESRCWCVPRSRCAPSRTASSRWAFHTGWSADRGFTERAEVRDALAYLKVTMSPDNGLALERIINTPKRGIGDNSVQKIHAAARSSGISLYRAAQDIATTEELPAKARKSLTGLLAQFARWRTQVQTMSHTKVAEIILDESGYTEMHQQDKDPKAPSRLENLKELVRSMQRIRDHGGLSRAHRTGHGGRAVRRA